VAVLYRAGHVTQPTVTNTANQVVKSQRNILLLLQLLLTINSTTNDQNLL